MTVSERIERLRKAILNEYPRLGRDDRFRFGCHRQVRCFNACCADVNIFLTPYDVLRLRKRLGLSSQEFLDRHTLLPIEKSMQVPVVALRMRDDEKKTCPFVDQARGCTVYEDRPWACRMYPVGLASPKEAAAKPGLPPAPSDSERDFYFLMREEGCFGFEEDREWTIAEWLENQGVPAYDAMGRLFKEVALHDFFRSGREMTPEKMEMFFIAAYNLDKFRKLIFGSSFFQRFKVAEDLKESLAGDDEELLRFGFRWLRFSLFGEKTMELADPGSPAAGGRPASGGAKGASERGA